MRRRRFPIGDRIGWCAVALIALMLAPDYPYAAFALVVSVAAILIGVKVDQRRSERRRLAADATAQHEALLAGSDQIGVYGRYPPPTPGGEVVTPATPWNATIVTGPLTSPPPLTTRVALEKVLEQHAEALSKLADS